MTTYLITGVAGFIGNNLARALLAQGHHVRGIDNFSTGKRANVEDIQGLDLIEGDITDLETVRHVTAGADYVLHQAAIPSVPRSIEAPLDSHTANVTGTVNVLEAARRDGGVRRVVVAASSAAYGDTPVLPKEEGMAPTPRSPYAVSKLAAEYYARVYTDVFGLETVCLRYFNIFGPRQDPNSRYAAVIPKFIESVLQDSSPPIFGDGRQTRDFTYIDNVVEANAKACVSEAAPGGVFNIACGQRVDLLTVLKHVNAVLGKQVHPEHHDSRPGDVRDSLADISRARQMLGYTAAVGFREGLERSIDWYRQNLGE